MASSDTEESELASRNRDLSLFLPFLLGLSSSSEDEDETSNSQNERIILINPFTQGMVVIDGGEDTFDTLFRELGAAKKGHPPASKASIEAMPSVEIAEIKEEDSECTICLEEWEAGRVVKEMPCKHRFHGDCIGKWLGIHGSCPVCRFKMPFGVDNQDQVDQGRDRERRRIGTQVWVSLSFNRDRRTSQATNQTPSADASHRQTEN